MVALGRVFQGLLLACSLFSIVLSKLCLLTDDVDDYENSPAIHAWKSEQSAGMSSAAAYGLGSWVGCLLCYTTLILGCFFIHDEHLSVQTAVYTWQFYIWMWLWWDGAFPVLARPPRLCPSRSPSETLTL